MPRADQPALLQGMSNPLCRPSPAGMMWSPSHSGSSLRVTGVSLAPEPQHPSWWALGSAQGIFYEESKKSERRWEEEGPGLMGGGLYLACICPFSRLQVSDLREPTQPRCPRSLWTRRYPKATGCLSHDLTASWVALLVPSALLAAPAVLTQVETAKKSSSQVCPGTRRNCCPI